jgi:tetratricopeptide (TPR) repeat protein
MPENLAKLSRFPYLFSSMPVRSSPVPKDFMQRRRCSRVAKEIVQRLHILAEQIRTQTRAGYVDDHHDLEGFMARFFNALFAWDLVNLNIIHPNCPAVDPGEFDRHLAFEITSTPALHNTTTADSKTVQNELYLPCGTPILFFLLPEKPEDSAAYAQADTGLPIKTWDLAGLLILMSVGPELSALEAAKNLLDEQLGQAGPLYPATGDPDALPRPAIHFIGRQKELDLLLPSFTANPRLAITGDGGLGKTALSSALLSAYRATPAGQRQTACGLHAHNFNQAPHLEAFLASILAHAGLESKDPASDRALVTSILSQPGVLLYIEGAEQLPRLEPLLDLIGPETALLLTTRHPVPAHLLPSHPLGPLEEADAIALLHYHAHAVPRHDPLAPARLLPEDAGWILLARDLGRHPLACRLAGTYCGINSSTPEEFHDALKAQGVKLLSQDDSRTENLNLLWRSIALALLVKHPGTPSPALHALHAWHCLSFAGTNPVPWGVLKAFGITDRHSPDILVQFGLVESMSVLADPTGHPKKHWPAKEPAYFLTHALLSNWAKQSLSAVHPTFPDFLPFAMAWGKDLLDEVVHNEHVPGGGPRYKLLAPLAESLLTSVQSGPTLPPDQLELFYALPALMHQFHGQFSSAEFYYQNAVAAMEQQAGPNSIPTAKALNNLAQLMQDTHRPAEAEPLMRRALAIKEACLGSDHPDVATHLNNLAQLLQASQRLTEAEPLMRRALEIDEASFGPDHPRVARHLSSLAQLLQVTHRLTEAEPMMWRALEISEANFGPDRPILALNLSNLVQFLQDTHRQVEAEPLMRRMVMIYLRSAVPTGHGHGYLRNAPGNYAGLCVAMEHPVEKIREQMFEMAEEAGMSREQMAGILGEIFPEG